MHGVTPGRRSGGTEGCDGQGSDTDGAEWSEGGGEGTGKELGGRDNEECVVDRLGSAGCAARAARNCFLSCFFSFFLLTTGMNASLSAAVDVDWGEKERSAAGVSPAVGSKDVSVGNGEHREGDEEEVAAAVHSWSITSVRFVGSLLRHL